MAQGGKTVPEAAAASAELLPGLAAASQRSEIRINSSIPEHEDGVANRFAGDELTFDGYDTSDNSSTQGKQIPLPVAGIIAASAAVTGIAASTASPAAGFALYALLLAGLSLVMLHVRRA